MKYSLGDKKVVAKGDHWIADNATVIGSVVLEEGASIWFNCVVRADNDVVTIGEGSQLQEACVVHVDPGHPCTLGKNVSIGHMVMLHGCTIGDNTLVGIGSIVLNGAKIGKNCLIGANCLITEGKEIPDNSLVMGAPGKVVREVSEQQAMIMAAGAHHYVENWKRYRRELTEVLR